MTYIPGGGGGGGSIATSSDVALNNTTDTQVLSFNGSVGKWVNGTFYTNPQIDALLASRKVTLLWNGASYPAKPVGASYAEFVGPTNPNDLGLMADGDTWIEVIA